MDAVNDSGEGAVMEYDGREGNGYQPVGDGGSKSPPGDEISTMCAFGDS